MPFSDKQIEAIILSTRITSVFNFLGSLFTIITFLIFKEARNGATSLIFSLSISDLLSGFSISFFWSIIFNSQSPIPCNLQASLLMFGLCASMLWGLMIGCYLFLVLYKNVDIEVVDRFLFVFHIISWGYALISAVLPIGFKQYGEMFPNKNSWCWVDDPKSAFRLLMYIPDSIIFTILVLLYGLVRFRLKSAKNSNSIANEICNKMSIYILTYAFINFFAIINRIQDFFSPDSAIFELYLLQFITQPLQGFLNAIAYVWNEPVFIESYKQLFAKLKFKHKPSKQIQSEKDRLMSLVCYENDP